MNGMCVEDPDYENHFCVDCGQCFCVAYECYTCNYNEEYRCSSCCNMAMNNLGCLCGRCISEPDLEEHLRTEHGDNFEYHTATPVVDWSYDAENHWKDCRFCDSEEHRTSLHKHSFDDYMECSICGYVGEMGPSIMGVVYSYGEEYTQITLELYPEDSNEPVKTLILDSTLSPYLIKGIENGNYTIKVTKDGHSTRSYNITVFEKISVLDIYLYENGDVTMDGEIDIIDYQQVVNATLKDTAVPDSTDSDENYALALCDYDGDGYIDAIDCALVARIIAGGLSVQYDSIEITGVTPPVANSTPSYQVTINSDKYELYDEDFGYIYNGVTWFDVTADSNMENTDTFIEGHVYRVGIEVVSKNGDGNLKFATVNGNNAQVSEFSDCYFVSYVFEV